MQHNQQAKTMIIDRERNYLVVMLEVCNDGERENVRKFFRARERKSLGVRNLRREYN